MNMLQITLENLVQEASNLHENERQLTLRSTLIVGMLERERAATRYGMSRAAFAEKIGLSENQYWKRAQASRIMFFYPETKAMIESGETSVSSLALLSSKLTAANKDILLAGIKGKSKREIRELLSVVTLDGCVIEREPTIEIKFLLTKTQLAKLDRACEILTAGGKTPEHTQVFEKAMDDLLWRRDPMQKAKRAELRAEKKLTSPAKDLVQEIDSIPAASTRVLMPGTSPLSPSPAPFKSRKPIPNAIRHQVWLREGGQCSWHHPDGIRCAEKKMLELDHIDMVCRGGSDKLSNLTLRCRYHNQVQAEQILGLDFMKIKRHRQKSGFAGEGIRTKDGPY